MKYKFRIAIFLFLIIFITSLDSEAADFRGAKIGMGMQQIKNIFGNGKFYETDKTMILKFYSGGHIDFIFDKRDGKLYHIIYKKLFIEGENFPAVLKKIEIKYGPHEYSCEKREVQFFYWGLHINSCGRPIELNRQSVLPDAEVIHIENAQNKAFYFELFNGKNYKELNSK